MLEEITPFDAADYLETADEVAQFLSLAFASANPGYIANALGVVARAEGMSEVARKTGLSREALYRSLTENGNPTLKSVLLVLNALGLTLAVQPKSAALETAATGDEPDLRQA